jgi:hypothetical protein
MRRIVVVMPNSQLQNRNLLTKEKISEIDTKGLLSVEYKLVIPKSTMSDIV